MKLDEITNSRPGDRCIVCGGSPDIIGIFRPSEPVRWGGAVGKTRLIRYCLCDTCHGRPETPEKAEKIIRSELSGGGVTHAE